MKSLIAALSVLWFCLTPSFLSPAEPAEVVFVNGNIYTVNEKQPRAEAIAVKGDRIVFVGSNASAKRFQGGGTRVIDLHGETVVPGMTDAHYHFIGVGQREMNLNLEGLTNLEDFLAKVKERVDRAKPGEWVTGRGWIETFWKPPVFPTRWDLDKISPNNPVFLTRADGHGAVANSAVLRIGGVKKDTKDLSGGQILGDNQPGEPVGMLLDNAQGFVARHIPAPTQAEIEQAIILANKRSIELGLTQVQDPGGSYRDVDLYKKLYGEGKLKLRIYKAVYGPGPEAKRLLSEGPIIEAFGDRLNVRAIKVVSDGALGSRGAALLEPYSDAPDSKGFLRVKEEDLLPMLKEALQKGIQVQTHAIGDYANRFILDEYEKALNAVPKSERKIAEPRWRDEHSQIVNPIDIPRFAKLGIIPSMQPAHAAFEENVRGSIEVGKLADLTILSADIMKIPEMEILKTHCLMTVIGGEVVYEAAPGAAAIETDFSRLPTTDLWWRSDVDDE